MNAMEFRAYDNQESTMVYDKDSWLPQGLKKLGFNQHPVHVSNQGIHYTLDCISNQYEDDWEQDVVTIHDIEIMQFTNFWDYGKQRKKIYGNDIISFYLPNTINAISAPQIGKIQLCVHSGDWIVVDKAEQFIERLSRVEQPIVLGNGFDNPKLLS